MSARTLLIWSGGGAAAVALAVLGVTGLNGDSAPHHGARSTMTGGVCLKTDIGFFEGAERRCYSREEIAALAERPVLNERGEAETVSLSHPTDLERDLGVAATCAVYRSLAREGWYALSTREIKREAYFQRACGALSLLEAARTPDHSHFRNGDLAESDVAALAAGPPFTLAESAPEQAVPSKASEYVWNLSAGDQSARIQEIAHADFNSDGLGDILVYVRLKVEGGTMSAGEIGIVEKRAAAGPARLHPHQP